MQVDEAPTPDRQDSKQDEHVLSMLLPNELTDGNTELITASPELTAAAVKRQPAQLTAEPERASPMHEVTAQYAHLHLSLLETMDLAATAYSAALPGFACTITSSIDHVRRHSHCAFRLNIRSLGSCSCNSYADG